MRVKITIASKTVPLTDKGVAALGVENHIVEVGYTEGSNVKIISGPLEGWLNFFVGLTILKY